MTSYIIRRLLMGVIIIVLVTIIVFLLMRIIPGDPLSLYMGPEVNSYGPKQLAALRQQYGLDKPLATQYLNWLGGVFHGNLGKSITFQKDVSALVRERLPVTFYIGSLSFIIGSILGIIFGVICAIKRGKWADTLFSAIANLGITLPGFWVGILLIYLLSFKLRLLPTYGYISPFEDLSMNIQMLIMPLFCLTINGMASVTRQTRSSMLEVTRQDYIRTAWAKGLGPRIIIIRHIIKNGLIPVVTTLGMHVRRLFGGSVLVETVFNVPGMGRMMKDAVMEMDYQVVQGGILIMALVIVLSNLIVDIIYGWIDPRIRYN